MTSVGLRLNAERIGRAVAHGIDPDQVIDEVAQALGCVPSRRQIQRIRRWASRGRLVRALIVGHGDGKQSTVRHL